MQVFCRQNHLTIHLFTHRMISHGIRMEANDMFEITSTASPGSTWDLKKHVRRYEWKSEASRSGRHYYALDLV